MFIEYMKVERFRHLHGVELGPFRQPSDVGELIVLAGPNGGGKSSLLELLSLGIASRYNYEYYQARQISNHAFGIKLALTDSELADIEAQCADKEVIDYARRNRGYWVHVNLPSVFGPDEQGINDRVHGAASREFTTFVRRLGFFIRSDRSYNVRSYRRDTIFNWKNREKPNHLRSISYSATNAQYEDMYDYLVEQSYHYIYELGLHARRQQRGEAGTAPEDPSHLTTSYSAASFPAIPSRKLLRRTLFSRSRFLQGTSFPSKTCRPARKRFSSFSRSSFATMYRGLPLSLMSRNFTYTQSLRESLSVRWRQYRPENQILDSDT